MLDATVLKLRVWQLVSPITALPEATYYLGYKDREGYYCVALQRAFGVYSALKKLARWMAAAAAQ